MVRIVLTGATFPAFEAEMGVAAKYGATFERIDCNSADDVTAAAKDSDILLVQFAQVGAEAIAGMADGSAIIRYGIGLDNIDLEAAQSRGVRVAYVPDYATGEVADHSAAMLIAALRKLLPLDQSVRDGTWDPVGIANPMPAFAESRLGFVGFGRIGREVHARLKPFGFSTMICDPAIDATAAAELDAESVDLETLFSQADALSFHCPLTPETHHLVNAARLSVMKPTAVIVNTARGGLIDPDALARALQSGTIGGAALDVFEKEPLPADSPLREAPNLILTPHVAWYSAQSAVRVQSLAADEIDRHLSGRPARCPAPSR